MKVGRLMVFSEPSTGADIYLDNQKQNLKTNAYFDLSPGTYTIKLVKDNAADPVKSEIGEAVVKIESGQIRRVVIVLNKTTISPIVSEGPVHPKSPGQKSIMDYYAALTAEDYKKAFAYFSRDGKSSQGGWWNFSRAVKDIREVKIVKLNIDSTDPTKSTETDRATLEILRKPPENKTASQTERLEVLITTIDRSNGAYLPKIESIVETETVNNN